MAHTYMKLTLSNPALESPKSPGQTLAIREVAVDALVDPSNPSSRLPADFVVRLQLSTRQQTRGLVTGPVLFRILGRETIDEAVVGGDQVVVGRTILSKLDLVVADGELRANPKHPLGPVLRV